LVEEWHHEPQRLDVADEPDPVEQRPPLFDAGGEAHRLLQDAERGEPFLRRPVDQDGVDADEGLNSPLLLAVVLSLLRQSEEQLSGRTVRPVAQADDGGGGDRDLAAGGRIADRLEGVGTAQATQEWEQFRRQFRPLLDRGQHRFGTLLRNRLRTDRDNRVFGLIPLVPLHRLQQRGDHGWHVLRCGEGLQPGECGRPHPGVGTASGFQQLRHGDDRLPPFEDPDQRDHLRRRLLGFQNGDELLIHAFGRKTGEAFGSDTGGRILAGHGVQQEFDGGGVTEPAEGEETGPLHIRVGALGGRKDDRQLAAVASCGNGRDDGDLTRRRQLAEAPRERLQRAGGEVLDLPDGDRFRTGVAPRKCGEDEVAGRAAAALDRAAERRESDPARLLTRVQNLVQLGGARVILGRGLAVGVDDHRSEIATRTAPFAAARAWKRSVRLVSSGTRPRARAAATASADSSAFNSRAIWLAATGSARRPSAFSNPTFAEPVAVFKPATSAAVAFGLGLFASARTAVSRTTSSLSAISAASGATDSSPPIRSNCVSSHSRAAAGILASSFPAIRVQASARAFSLPGAPA